VLVIPHPIQLVKLVVTEIPKVEISRDKFSHQHRKAVS
jgi:hypothetical protein